MANQKSVESVVKRAYDNAMLEKGLVQIYTGDGKGKTTAAFGLSLRATGQGNKVLIYQFLKPSSLEIGERFALQISGLKIRVETMDIPWDMTKSPKGAKSPKDPKAVATAQAAIHKALDRLAESAAKREYDILILDELVYCVAKGLAKLEDVKKVIDGRDKHVEIVMTGRGATQELMDMADLVTEMKNIKHPFDKGTNARRGIEF
ncbi:MAG: cob(I)yrinic acid a,c-diamide adenosyltransferase [Sedimentisphaerales bacterium]|nr:cob(I)yrinic acid a,c-diamide adenosyltransferase [Sedimentisphaerales bacterium]